MKLCPKSCNIFQLDYILIKENQCVQTFPRSNACSTKTLALYQIFFDEDYHFSYDQSSLTFTNIFVQEINKRKLTVHVLLILNITEVRERCKSLKIMLEQHSGGRARNCPCFDKACCLPRCCAIVKKKQNIISLQSLSGLSPVSTQVRVFM